MKTNILIIFAITLLLPLIATDRGRYRNTQKNNNQNYGLETSNTYGYRYYYPSYPPYNYYYYPYRSYYKHYGYPRYYYPYSYW